MGSDSAIRPSFEGETLLQAALKEEIEDKKLTAELLLNLIAQPPLISQTAFNRTLRVRKRRATKNDLDLNSVVLTKVQSGLNTCGRCMNPQCNNFNKMDITNTSNHMGEFNFRELMHAKCPACSEPFTENVNIIFTNCFMTVKSNLGGSEEKIEVNENEYLTFKIVKDEEAGEYEYLRFTVEPRSTAPKLSEIKNNANQSNVPIHWCLEIKFWPNQLPSIRKYPTPENNHFLPLHIRVDCACCKCCTIT